MVYRAPVALVTSPTHKLGFSLAKIYLEKGYDLVFITWRRDLAEKIMLEILTMESRKVVILRQDWADKSTPKMILNKLEELKILPKVFIGIPIIEENTVPDKSALPGVTELIISNQKSLITLLQSKWSMRVIAVYPDYQFVWWFRKRLITLHNDDFVLLSRRTHRYSDSSLRRLVSNPLAAWQNRMYYRLVSQYLIVYNKLLELRITLFRR